MTSKSTSDFMRNNPCKDILSTDGNGIPEQFWNCAEVSIQKSSSSPMTTQDDSLSVTPLSQSLDVDEASDDDSYSTTTMSTVSLPSGPTLKTIMGTFRHGNGMIDKSWQRL